MKPRARNFSRLFDLVVSCCWALMTTGVAGAASVGPAGYTNSFNIQPPAADWATLSIAGGGGDTYDMDAEVAAIAAGGVTGSTIVDGGNPPGANGLAAWSSAGLYLQTRPTFNRLTVLTGKFLNNTGSNVTRVAVSYLNTIVSTGTAEDPGKGTRLYYSLTGLAGSWINLPALSTTASANVSSSTGTNITLNWPSGGNLFLLWVDDNSGSGTDSAYQLDNFSLRVTGGTPTNYFCIVTAPAPNTAHVVGTFSTATALAGNGTPPYTVEYFTNSGAGNSVFTAAGVVGTAPYSLALGALPLGTHSVFAVVTDSAGVPRSTNSATNTFTVVNPIDFALIGPSDGATFDHTTPVTGTASVSGGTPPYSVQYYLDDALSGAPVNAPPYRRDFGTLFVGAHTLRATVTDAKGWSSNSSVTTIQLSGPLAALLAPAHGLSLAYDASLAVTATIAGGTAPYAALLFVNGQPMASFQSPPFQTNLGTLPPGNYSCYVRTTDSSEPAQTAYSPTNLITIRPPPLRIMPVGDSITLGLSVPGGYRAPLYQLLTNAGHEVDYVGTQTGNASPNLPDNAHEGYGGWVISQIDGVILGSLAAVADPDIILLLIGVNDYLTANDTAHATNRLEALIAKMAVARPNAKIIVGSLTRLYEPYNSQTEATFNPFLPGICERQRGLGRQVYFTDMHSAVPLADMPDQLHPNQLGYNKMATNWFAAIQALPCSNCPPRFTLHPKSQSMLPGTNVILMASATNAGAPVQYQWRFDGADIPNATNATYAFSNASILHQGDYAVAATDIHGTTVSSNAFLHLFLRPAFVVNPVPQSVLEGRTATFSAMATGAPPIWYRWFSNGVARVTNSTGVFILSNVQAGCTIHVVATNFASGLSGVLMTPPTGVTLTMIPDFDRDGMGDAWEIQHGFSTNNVGDAEEDFDFDGLSNLAEYVAGTDPTNAFSVLRLALNPTNTGILEFLAQSNIAYTVQYRTDLLFGAWGNLTNISAHPQSRTVPVRALNPAATPELYYRVVTPPSP